MRNRKAPESCLRIGLVLEGKLVEEQLIRARQPVTLGYSPRNTLALPAADLPRTWPLFQPTADGGWTLCVPDGVEARLATGGGAPAVLPAGARVPLGGTSRGKIMCGETTVLFQVVAARPVERVQLPASVRRRFADRIDPYLAAVLAVSFVLHAGAGTIAAAMDSPRKPQPDEIVEDQFVVLHRSRVLPKPKPPKPAPAPGPTVASNDPAPNPQPAATTPASKNPGPRRRDDGATPGRGDRATDAQTALNAITRGARGGGGRHQPTNPTVAQNMGDRVGNGQNGNQQVANAGDRHVPNGNIVSANTTDGGPTIRGAGDGEDRNTQVATNDVTPGTTTIKRPTTTGTGGKLDPDALYRRLGEYRGEAMRCYENVLRQDSGVHGSMTVTITVGTDGRVTQVVAEGVDPRLERCVEQKARGWQFAKPEGGPAKFRFTLDFAREDS